MNPLVDTCLKHLAEEEALLVRTRAALQSVRSAIGQGSPKDLAEALQRQDAVLQLGASVRDQRGGLRQALGKQLGVPADQCSVRLLTDLPREKAEQVWQARQRIRQLSVEVDRLNHNIAVVSHYQLDFLQQLFGEITGAGQHGGCYGPEGQRRDPVCGSLIELRG